jgi:hypothetical protein
MAEDFYGNFLVADALQKLVHRRRAVALAMGTGSSGRLLQLRIDFTSVSLAAGANDGQGSHAPEISPEK